MYDGQNANQCFRQHYKIIHSKTSQGLNPIFLLLGSTSAASGMLNVSVVSHFQTLRSIKRPYRITLQWLIIQCCKYLSPGDCIESLGAIWIVGLQWFFFTTM